MADLGDSVAIPIVGTIGPAARVLVYDPAQPVKKSVMIEQDDFLAGTAQTGADAAFDDLSANTVSAPVGSINTLTVATALVINHRLTFMATGTIALPATLAANTAGNVVLALTGVVAGDLATVGGDNLPDALILKAGVTSAGNVTVRVYNPTASLMTLGQTVRVKVERLST